MPVSSASFCPLVELDPNFLLPFFAAYNYAAATYFPKLPHVGNCSGEEYAAISGCAVLSSYLLLFIACESIILWCLFQEGYSRNVSDAGSDVLPFPSSSLPQDLQAQGFR